LPTDRQRTPERLAENDAKALLLFGAIELEWNLFALLDLPPVEDAELCGFDQRLGPACITRRDGQPGQQRRSLSGNETLRAHHSPRTVERAPAMRASAAGGKLSPPASRSTSA